jgi:predicted glycosyl hydrolase (DUF1957 family)
MSSHFLVFISQLPVLSDQLPTTWISTNTNKYNQYKETKFIKKKYIKKNKIKKLRAREQTDYQGINPPFLVCAKSTMSF